MDKTKLKKELDILSINLSPEIKDDCVIISHPECPQFDKTFSFNDKSIDNLLLEIKGFISYKYLQGKYLYKENYAELLIDLANSESPYILGHCNFTVPSTPKQNTPNYEISEISDIFYEFIDNTCNFEYQQSDLVTLKINDLNKITNVSTESNAFKENIEQSAKWILFNIAYKTSIFLTLSEIDIPTQEQDSVLCERFFDRIKAIDSTSIDVTYDKDLVSYYYRAMCMDTSEFKYLAFYQVIECIFDETYLSDTIRDTRQLLQSASFSLHNDDEIKEVIKLIEKYNTNKTDREKTLLVLNKYFKGDMRNDAYILAYKDIFVIIEEIDKTVKPNDITPVKVL